MEVVDLWDRVLKCSYNFEIWLVAWQLHFRAIEKTLHTDVAT